MKQAKPRAAIQPLAYTQEQFYTQVYPSSRASTAAWIRTGELPSFTDGRRRLIPADAAHEFVRRKIASGSGTVPADVSAVKSAAGRKGREVQLAESATDKVA